MTVYDLTHLAILAALILLNALFVAAEFALVGAPRAVIDRLAAENHRIARAIRAIQRDPREQDRYLATAQLGIAVASLGLGMYGETYLAERIVGQLHGLETYRWVAAHGIASVVAVGILTYFHIVLGEMVPKSLALQYPERAALWVTPPILWVKVACYPLIFVLNAAGNAVLHAVGIQRGGADSDFYHTTEDLQYIVEESQAGGLLREESGQVLLDLFEFGDLTAAEAMVPRVGIAGIPVDASPQALLDIVRAEVHTRYPVFDGDLDHIVGMIHIKDVLRDLVGGSPTDLKELRPMPFVPETAPLDTVLSVMQQERAQMVVVMDEHGGTAGLVTANDLFEELVGDIAEGEAELPEIRYDDAKRLHVTGTVRIEEVGEALNAPLEHEEVDTVSGLILSLLNRPAAVGDTVVYNGVEFHVTAVEGHGVKECIAALVEQPES